MKKEKSSTILWFLILLLAIFVGGCGSNDHNDNSDLIVPTVTSTTPLDGAAHVALNSAIAVTFSEAMAPATLVPATFTLQQGTTAVAGSVTYAGLTALFTPESNLLADREYTATLTTGVTDLAGNGLAGAYTWTFVTGNAADTTAPTVSGTLQANNAVNVALNSQIGATFSEGMEPSTMTAANFTLEQSAGNVAVAGSVSYSGVNLLFTPASNLAGSTNYTVTIKGGPDGVKDLAGNFLAADYLWSWTTAATADLVAPTVTSTTPTNLGTGVAINSRIYATFSETMAPLSVTTATFTLVGAGNTPVLGTVGYNALTKIATFRPAAPLTSATLYTATIKTGVKDLAGNPLALRKVWTFTTGSAAALGPAPVLLGTAGDFVILAKSAVTTTGTTAVVGAIGLSPAAATYIEGFSLIADPGNAFSISSYVTGKIFAADYAVPTPTYLTTAVGDMETAFTDAASRPTPDYLDLGAAGDITGLTLVPGLYKWTTGVLIQSGGVTLSGGANDVWILQIAGDLTVANSAIITLSPGVQPKNIFWQVSGQATLGTAADFKGILLSQTLIALNTGAIMNGRALAQTAVTLNATAITAPSE